MELRHLRYFVAVAEELHFRRAAERLHVAQPAVSEQIRKLEQELGVRLFDRTQRTVSLTEPGAALLAEARLVLQQAEQARMAARDAHQRGVATLRVGYLAAALPGSLPRALQRLATSMPHLRTTLHSASSFELIEAVRSERLDAALVSLPAPTNGLRTTVIGEQRAIAAFPLSHNHACKSAVRLEQIAPERIVVLPREANRAFYDAVIATCHRAGLAPTVLELPDAHIERGLMTVAAGAGMALLPESVADRYSAPGVRFVPLEGDAPAFTAAMLTRRDSAHMPTVALLRAVSQAATPRSFAAAQHSLAAA